MKYAFVGIDKDLEISLREHGLLVSIEPHTDGSGTHFIIYRTGCNDEVYGCGHMSEEAVNGYMLGREFMDNSNILEVLNYLDMKLDEWLIQSLVTKLHDLISYYGCDNIMGTDYNPVTYEEAMNNWVESKTKEDV